MAGSREHLIACFTAVFPDLDASTAPAATVDTTAEWDSAHHILLMQVIEESFGIRIPEAVLGEIQSFAGFEDLLARDSRVS
jgi:acyl carrier protein